MIVITGSSYGAGEWSEATPSSPPVILHNGLAQYLEDSGNEVINLSQPGGVPGYVYTSILDNFLTLNTRLSKVDKIFVFESNWTDNFLHVLKQQQNNLVDYELLLKSNYLEFISYCQYKFYAQLSKIGTKFNIPIFLIGAINDIIWTDDFSKSHPMVNISCQSFINLVLHNNHRIQEPVVGVFTSRHVELVDYIKPKLSNTDFTLFINHLDNNQYRLKQIIANKGEFFCADGVHASRKSHKILFDFLKETIPNL